jgi:4a-hydroxytetrahydrobiopterin dehydratase
MKDKLKPSEIPAYLKALKGWKKKGNQIYRYFEFPTFADSIKFTQKVAKLADKMDHHPDILIQYNWVTLTLSSHDVKGLSKRDFKLAGQINKLV